MPAAERLRNLSSLLDWGRALAGAVRDTARAFIDETKQGMSEAQDEAWKRFEEKTKRPRRRR